MGSMEHASEADRQATMAKLEEMQVKDMLRMFNGLVERWCMCRHLARHLAPDHVHAEPLLPPPYRREAEVPDLARELRDAGAAPAQASKACRQLGLEAQKALQWLVHQPPPTATKVSVTTPAAR